LALRWRLSSRQRRLELFLKDMHRDRKFSRMLLMRISPSGQVTIPLALRERAGLTPETEVEIELDGDALRIVRARKPATPGRGEQIVEHLRGRATAGMTTDEILSMTRER